MTTLTTVPEGATALDVLATRYRIAFNKTQTSREQWIEGTLELASIMLEARELLPVHTEFNHWMVRNQLVYLHPNERMALIGMGELARRNPTAIRKLLEENISLTWRTIWEKKANKLKPALTRTGRGGFSRTSGSSYRKRRNRIPDAMRDDSDQPSKPSAAKSRLVERKPFNAGKDDGLTREQVDPDFKGTSTEFISKYGHVHLHTKQEIEQHKQQEKLAMLLGAMTQHARTARDLITAFTDIDADTLRAWQQKNGKAEKWQAWCKDVALACERVRKALD